MKKKIFIIISIGIVLALLFKGYKSFDISASYLDDYEPSTNYYITINKLSKRLTVKTVKGCSATECDDITYKGSIMLTTDEYKKIMKLWENKDKIMSLLETLSKGNKTFYDSVNNSYETDDEYNRQDTNKDGIVTYREFADDWLNSMIDENE